MSDIELLNSESEKALLRARERARAFVCQAAPQSPTEGSPNQLGNSYKSLTEPQLCNRDKETVKSSLKSRPGLTRTASEPIRKSVHFSTTNLEDVRQFKRGQRPSAVGTGERAKFYCADTLDLDDDDIDDEDDDEDEDDESSYFGRYSSAALGLDEFDEDGIANVPRFRRPSPVHRTSKNAAYKKVSPKKEDDSSGWTLLTPGFVPHSNVRVPGPQRPVVYLENLQFVERTMEINAAVFVRNISFTKQVALRYTVDGWKSFGESTGIWSDDIRKFDRESNYDRFDVVIPLNLYSAELLNSATIQVCARYYANNVEYWDNNNGTNYELYLRNQRLASSQRQAKVSTIPTATTITNPASTVPTFMEPKKHQHHASEPYAVGVARSADEILRDDYDPFLDDLHGDSDKKAMSDFLRNTGLTMKKVGDVELKDQFKNRYSFKASYSPTKVKEVASRQTNKQLMDRQELPEFVSPSVPLSPADTQSSTSTLPSTSTGSPAVSPSTTSQSFSHVPFSPPSPVELKVTVPESQRGPANQETVIQTQKVSGRSHAWESDSYKDFVSKYCFYTPHEGRSGQSSQSNNTSTQSSSSSSRTQSSLATV